MELEAEIKIKCGDCEKWRNIEENVDYSCEFCVVKIADEQVMEALKDALPRSIVKSDELMETPNSSGWILLGKCTEREKEMFISGVGFGANQVLFDIADTFGIADEWETIKPELLKKLGELQ